MTAVGVLTVAGSANAQLLGTWYTDQTEWLKLVTNASISTASYTNDPTGDSWEKNPWEELGITATATSGYWYSSVPGRPRRSVLRTLDNNVPITFTFSGNAFAGLFGMTDYFTDVPEVSGMTFSIDGSVTESNYINSTQSGTGFTFLSYISDSAAPISVKITGDDSNHVVTVDSFSFGQSTRTRHISPCAYRWMCTRRNVYPSS